MAVKYLEITLDNVDISGRIKSSSSKHLVTVELLWPRPLVAQKSIAKPLTLKKGLWDGKDMPWHKRMLFKESVEYRFAVGVKVTESLTQAYIDNFFSFIGGQLFGIAGSLVEDALPSVAGDVAAAPLDYAKKKLSAAGDPEVILEGCVDLVPDDIPSDGMKLELPLLTIRDDFELKGNMGPKGNVKRKQLVTPAGTLLGSCTLFINCLSSKK